MSNFLRLVGGLLAALPLLLSAPALADPPARVGRLAHIEEPVEFRLTRDDPAGPATPNWPISSGAILETGASGRAEVWVDSTAFRLGRDSQVEFTTIDDQLVVLELSGGSLAISIMEAEQAGDLQLRLPDGTIRFAAAGRYRLDVGPERSEVTTLAGLASIEHTGGRAQLAAGSKATLFADGGLRIGASDRPDGFDRWVAERENATQAPLARRHVSPYMTGYQDLDGYGDWNAHDEYGSVWYPRAVADDWAPYRFGRWAWVAPWGWTWIDAAPWGFAPFHYGRWVQVHGRWAWVPGQRTVRPVYAPALVAWIGDPGWSVSFSFGLAPAVGWFPLAPREVYVPSYRHSPTYIRRVNVTHVHNVTIIDRAARSRGDARFAHRSSPQAVTVMPASQLRQGRAITGREFRRVDRQDLGRAPVVGAASSREWLAPAPEARRPRPADGREWSGRNERRAAEIPAGNRLDDRAPRRFGAEAPSAAPATVLPQAAPPSRRELREPPAVERALPPSGADGRRERSESRRGERDDSRNTAPSGFGQPPVVPAETVQRPPALQSVPPAVRQPPSQERVGERPEADNRRERSESRRGERDDFRNAAPPGFGQPLAVPAETVQRPPALQSVPPTVRQPPSLERAGERPEADNRRERPENRRGERDATRQERSFSREVPAPVGRQPEAAPAARSGPPALMLPVPNQPRETREAPRAQPAFVDRAPARRSEEVRPAAPAMRLPEAAAPPAGREQRGDRGGDRGERGERGGGR
ncbi:MAG: hypothetical protein CVU18_14720 [Betaproteobacteria bacterium HGW-Betaproteobacteria-12]|nr:MAG: hypothetical protein CVU18_14720 [Betaproteobacteria bacterium HGW-Betaproteobacteria-12]